MLPSMPILFSRESQDRLSSNTQPATSFFSQNSSPQLVIPEVVPEAPPKAPKQVEAKNKLELEKKNDPPSNDENALENAFIRSYYQRVQSRFSSNTSVPTNKFVQFQNLLRNFNPNVETPIDLYKKIDGLFGVEHKDIVEEFLLFLKPGQAVEVGRFMDRFQLAQMTGFINMLHTTFARKPTVLRKVLRALTNALNSGTSEEVKARVLPHLRSNPRLTQLFKSLFPDERPADSLYESGVDMANESILSNDRGCDVWEFEHESDTKRKLTAKEEVDTMFMNGRVFLQHGRLLRSARVTYPYSKEPYRVHARRLAPAHCHITPPDTDEETPQKQPKNNTPKRTRKQTKSPTKKDVNDNTKNNIALNNSPKPKKSQKSKNVKKETDSVLQKRERKDSKNVPTLKKDADAPKPKQARIEASNVEAKIEPAIKLEAKIETPGKVETRNQAPTNAEVNTVAPANDKASISHVHEKSNIATSVSYKTNIVAPISFKANIVTPVSFKVKIAAPVNDKVNIVIPINDKVNIATPVNDNVNIATPVNENVNIVTPVNDNVNVVTLVNDNVNIKIPVHDKTTVVTSVNIEAKIDCSTNVEAKIEASVSVEAKKIEVKSNNWTRDEDKTMLQVLKGEAGSEKVFGRIRELLPHRSASEIKERFCHVMTLLQQMAVSEVT